MNAQRTLSPVTAGRQLGLSLVEVLVAMVLGLVVLGAVGYLFIGSKKTNATQTDLIRMQESARNTMEVMGKALRQAGYKLDVSKPMNGVALVGTDGGAVEGAVPGTDTVTVYHDPNWRSGGAHLLEGQELDCEGNTVTSNNPMNTTTGVAPVNTNMVAYRFFVKDGTLRCSSTPAVLTDEGVVIANGVENLQVTYGVGSGGEVISAYKPNAEDAALPNTAEFATTGAVRVSVLVRGTTPTLVPGNSQKLILEGVEHTFTDGFLRQVYSSTFTIRNQAR